MVRLSFVALANASPPTRWHPLAVDAYALSYVRNCGAISCVSWAICRSHLIDRRAPSDLRAHSGSLIINVWQFAWKPRQARRTAPEFPTYLRAFFSTLYLAAVPSRYFLLDPIIFRRLLGVCSHLARQEKSGSLTTSAQPSFRARALSFSLSCFKLDVFLRR
jgi:hypothetical protein